MKRSTLAICVIMFILICILVASYSTNGVRAGMTYDQAVSKVDAILVHNGYLYYHNWAGNSVVARFGSIYDPSALEIVEIRCYSALLTSNYHFDFTKINNGMTPFEVTALVGLPDASRTSGINTLDYKAADGTAYRIGWDYGKDAQGRSDLNAPVVHSVCVCDSEGNYLSIDETAAFQWTVRLVYLGIAAILGVVLVLLIKIPNNVRKRKAATQPE